MSGIVINELVTKFCFQTQKPGIKAYEKELKRLDQLGQKVGNRAGKAFQTSMGQAAKQISRQYGSMFSQIQRQANAIKMHASVHVDNSSAKAKIKEIDGMASGLSRRLGSMALGLAGTLGALNIGKDFATALVDRVGTKQSNMGRLTTQMGSEASAKQIYSWLRKEAEVTPFEKNELISGFSTIKGSGYQLTQADLRGIGDVTSGSKKEFGMMIEMLKSANRGLGMMVDNFDGMKARAHDGVLSMERFDKRLNKWIKEDIEAGDMAGFVRFVRTHGERNYKGEMDRQSQTIPGLLSTIRDRFTSRMEDIGDSGMEGTLTDIMQRGVKIMGDLEPQAKRLGKSMSLLINSGLKKFPAILSEIKKLAPLAAAGLSTLGSYVLGAKLIAVAKGIWGMVAAARALSLAQIGMAGLPLLIGGAVIGLGALGYHLATTGETGKIFREEFDKMKPTLKEVWGDFQALGKELMEDFGPIVKDVFQNVVVPGVKAGLLGFRDFMKDWRAGYAELKTTILPGMVDSFKSFVGDIEHWMQNLKNTFNLYRETLDPILAAMEKIPGPGQSTFRMARERLGWVNAGSQGSGPDGSSANLGDRFNSLTGDQISRASMNIVTGKGWCLWHTKKSLQAVYGDFKGPGGMNVAGFKGRFAPGGDAADFGPTLMGPEFNMRRIKVSSISDIPDGATLIWPRGVAGFSSKSGHIEQYDKETGSFNYGMGPDKRRFREQYLSQADVYVPTKPGMQNVTMAPYGQNAQGSQPLMNNGMLNPIVVNQTFQGQQNSQQFKQDVKIGIGEAITLMNSKFSSPARR
jgi:hypothetical protein